MKAVLYMCAKSKFERLVFSVAYAFALLMFLSIFSSIPLTVTLTYKEAYNSLTMTTTFSALISCWGEELAPEELKPCVSSLKEHVKISVTDLFTGKKYEASNTAFYERKVEYWMDFDYPLKICNEVHPAKIRVEVLRFSILP